MIDLTEDMIGEGHQLVPVSNTTYNLFEGVVYQSTNNHVIADSHIPADNVTFNLNGIVTAGAADRHAVYFQDGGGHNITVGATGELTGYYGLSLQGSFASTVINNGLIRSSDPDLGVGLVYFGGEGNVTNTTTGSIVGSVGVFIGGGLDNTFINDGVVAGSLSGIRFTGTGSFINNGTVTGEQFGILTSDSDISFVNTGSIISQSGEDGAAIVIGDEGDGPDMLIENSGFISGGIAFDGSSSNETFWNIGPNGMVVGDVFLREGDDTFRNFSANSINGDVRGGSGDDRFFGGAGTERFYGDDGDDYFELGGGQDIAFGGAGDDITFGLDGEDTIYGGAGDDILHGNRENDHIYGNSGNDFLFGGFHNDFLAGGADDDFLYGSLNNDVLYGGTGDDNLFGGPSADVLTGGLGFDRFVQIGFFGDDDVITDFVQGEDLIVLRNVAGLNDVIQAATDVDGDTFIDFGTNQSFTIEGINTIELTSNDFEFTFL